MNQQQLQQIQSEQEHALQQILQANRAVETGMGIYAVLMIIFYAGLLVAGITAIHCAHRGPKEGRTAWTIVILAVPFLGWISYWMISDRQRKDDGVFAGIR